MKLIYFNKFATWEQTLSRVIKSPIDFLVSLFQSIILKNWLIIYISENSGVELHFHPKNLPVLQFSPSALFCPCDHNLHSKTVEIFLTINSSFLTFSDPKPNFRYTFSKLSKVPFNNSVSFFTKINKLIIFH